MKDIRSTAEWLPEPSYLWMTTGVTYVLGDLVTTYVAIRYTDAREANLFASSVLSLGGFEALIGMKLIFIALLFTFLKYNDDYATEVLTAAGVTALGILVTVWNSTILLWATLFR